MMSVSRTSAQFYNQQVVNISGKRPIIMMMKDCHLVNDHKHLNNESNQVI